MKRKIIGAAAAYLSGLFFASFFSGIYGMLMLTIAVIVVIFGGIRRNFTRSDYILLAATFMTALTVGTLHEALCYDRITAYSGTNGSFVGTVSDYDIYDGGKASYVLKGSINGEKRAKLYVYTDDLGAEYGDIVTIGSCTFEHMESDYLYRSSENYNRSRHIFLCTFDASKVTAEHSDRFHPGRILRRFREMMHEKMYLTIGVETSAFLAGMIFGEKQYLDGSVRTSLYRVGIGHILAVSGLHVSIIAAISMRIMRRLGIGKFARFGIINALLLLLIALTNYPISAIRAAIMLDIMYAAPLFRRQNDTLNSLSLAALVICIFDPYAIYSGGFLLSLSGTFGIAVLGPYMIRELSRDDLSEKMRTDLIIALWTALCVLPMCVLFFDEASLIAPLSNIILVPACTIAMVLGLIFVISGGTLTLVLYPAKWLITGVIAASDTISRSGFCTIPRINDSIPMTLMLTGAAAVCLYFITNSRRYVTYISSLGIATAFGISLYFGIFGHGTASVAMLGQGNNAVVVVTDGISTDIFDLSGHHRSPKYAAKYLAQNGINRADSVNLTARAPSQEINYRSELELFDIVGFNSDPRIDIDRGDYFVTSDSGILTVTAGETELTIMPAKENTAVENGIAVYYGRLSKDTIFPDNTCIFLDEENCFEIILSADGHYKIRSL